MGSVTGTTSRLEELVANIVGWHHDRNLIDGSDDKTQFLKLISEAGECATSIAKGKSVADDIGDQVVVLLNIATRNGLTLEQCLEVAWNDIKDRKGRMINGTFVKEADLPEGSLLDTLVSDVTGQEGFAAPADFEDCAVLQEHNQIEKAMISTVSEPNKAEVEIAYWDCPDITCGTRNSILGSNPNYCTGCGIPRKHHHRL